MGRIKTFVSDIQKDAAVFPLIKSDIKKFGYQAIAKAGGLKAYQTVWKYYIGKPVLPLSEEKILLGIKNLLKGDHSAKKVVKDIINIHSKEEEVA